MIQGFFVPSAPLSSPYHLDNVAFCHGGYGDGGGHLGRREALGENFVGFSRLQTNPLTVGLSRALTYSEEEVLKVGCGSVWLRMRYGGVEEKNNVFLVV